MTKNNLQEHCHTNNITKLEIQKKILYTQLSQYCSGCEIWGTFNTFSAKFRHGMQNLSFDQIYCLQQKAELLHQKFWKYILGVHQKSTNFAVLSELGRFPLHFNVIKAMIRYYDRLKNIEEMFPLLHAAYKESISIDDSNHASWFSSIKLLAIK